MGKTGSLCGPISERAAETVRRQIAATHSRQGPGQHQVAHAFAPAEKHKARAIFERHHLSQDRKRRMQLLFAASDSNSDASVCSLRRCAGTPPGDPAPTTI